MLLDAPGARDIVLEPDALLLLRGEALRDQVANVGVAERVVQPTDRDAFARIASWGFVDDNTWAVALNVDAFNPLWLDAHQDIDIVMTSRHGGRASVMYRPTPGDRRVVSVTFEGGNDGRTSSLLVKWEGSQAASGQPMLVELYTPERRKRADDSTGFDGAHMTIRGRQYFASSIVDVASEQAVFDGVPTGLELVAIALDKGNHRFGMVSFYNIGAPVLLELRNALSVSGRVILGDSAPLPGHQLRASWGFTATEGQLHSVWSGESVIDGSLEPFVLHLPDYVPRVSARALPPYLRLTLELNGYLPLTLVQSIEGQAWLDLGELVFSRSIPTVGVILETPLDTSALQYQTVRFGPPHSRYGYEVAGATGGDKEAQIEFAIPPGATRPNQYRALDFATGQWITVEWPSDPEAFVLQEEGATQGRGFEALGDGTFREAKRNSYSIQATMISMPQGGKHLYYGWMWRGIPCVLGWFYEHESRAVHSHTWLAPSSGVDFWWATNEGIDGLAVRPLRTGENYVLP